MRRHETAHFWQGDQNGRPAPGLVRPFPWHRRAPHSITLDPVCPHRLPSLLLSGQLGQVAVRQQTESRPRGTADRPTVGTRVERGLPRAHGRRAICVGFGGIRDEIRRPKAGNALCATNLHSSGAEQSQGTRDRHDVAVVDLHHRREKSLRGLKRREASFRRDVTRLLQNPTRGHEATFYPRRVPVPTFFFF